MLIGCMNHPARDVIGEIEWIARMGLEFIDLTLEPPAAASWMVDAEAIRAALRQHGLKVVGHTAYYLPIASGFEDLRLAAVAELRHCLEVFRDVGASWMNLHPDHFMPFRDRSCYIQTNLKSIRELLRDAQRTGVGIMIENLPEDFNSPAELGDLLDAEPELGLHLDIGHANLQTSGNKTKEILAAYGPRLRHVHLHDNKGGSADLHLPLGAGTLDLRSAIGALRQSGYDGTITLEVFTPDKRYVEYSRDVLRRLWTES